MDPIYADLFSFLRLFGPLTKEDESLLLPHMEVVELKKKETLLSAGQYCKHLWFIQQGLIRTYRLDNGHEINTAFLGEGHFFTDFESVLLTEPCFYTVQAIESTTMIQIPYQKMLDAYKASHTIEHLGRLMVERAFASTIKSLRPAAAMSPTERYEQFQSEEPELAARVPLKLLASYLRMAPETISRIRKRRFERSN